MAIHGNRAAIGSLAGADAVIHLAGEPVAQRWTPEVKRRIREQPGGWDPESGERLVEAIPAPAGAGLRLGDRLSTGRAAMRSSPKHPRRATDFLAEVVVDWEKAARQAEASASGWSRCGFGVVLGKEAARWPRCCRRSGWAWVGVGFGRPVDVLDSRGRRDRSDPVRARRIRPSAAPMNATAPATGHER